MELWRQLRQAGLVPPGLGPPPRALRGVPPSERAGQTLMSPGAYTEDVRRSLLWIWEELENLRRVDVELLGQLCSLGLEMALLREELVDFLEEEEEEDEEDEEEEDEILKEEEEEEDEEEEEEEEILKEEEEDEEPKGNQEEGHLEVCPAPGHRLPDFEMTI